MFWLMYDSGSKFQIMLLPIQVNPHRELKIKVMSLT